MARWTCWLTIAPAWRNFLTTGCKLFSTANSSGVASPLSWALMSMAGWESNKSKYSQLISALLLFHWLTRMCKGVRPPLSRWFTLAPNRKRIPNASGRLLLIAMWMDDTFSFGLKSFTSAPASSKSSVKAKRPRLMENWRQVTSCGNSWNLLICDIRAFIIITIGTPRGGGHLFPHSPSWSSAAVSVCLPMSKHLSVLPSDVLKSLVPFVCSTANFIKGRLCVRHERDTNSWAKG